MQLLSRFAVVDYDADNVPAYTTYIEDVPIVPFLNAPYLKPEVSLPLAERPIDVLFIGSMNERRRDMINRIESTGARSCCSIRLCMDPSETSSSNRLMRVQRPSMQAADSSRRARVALPVAGHPSGV